MLLNNKPDPILDSIFESVYNDTNKYINSNGIDNKIIAPGLMPANYCLLTTRGWITQQWRRNPLFYTKKNSNIYVIGSRGGLPNHPQWYKNILNFPIAWIQIESDEYWATCRTLETENDQELRLHIWNDLCSSFPPYRIWQNNCPQRQFPIIEIKRI